MSEQEITDLIGQLGDFRTRSAAIRQIVSAGELAVQPLLEGLESTPAEGIRWAILRCLGGLRAADAVPRIASLLEDPGYRTAAHDALVRIVGKDLGRASGAWLRWTKGSGAGGAPEMHATGYSDERLVELAMEGSGASCRNVRSGMFTVDVPLRAGRKQDVTVNLSAKDHEGSPIAIVYADCGPAAPQHHEYALRRNLRMPYGALAIRDADGGPCFVMFNTLLREALSPLELKKSIFTVGGRAARVQEELEEQEEQGGALDRRDKEC